jgi:hypothetical protein
MLTSDKFKIDSSVVPSDDIIKFNKDRVNLVTEITSDISKLGATKIDKMVDDFFTLLS